jgi:hypothetical protein
MDPINRLNHMMEALRREMAEKAQRFDQPGTSGKSAEASSKPQGRLSVPELKRRIQERIRAVSPDDKGQQNKARRIFLESVLTWEFGEALLLDKDFDELLDKIEKTFESSPEMDAQFSQLVEELSAG